MNKKTFYQYVQEMDLVDTPDDPRGNLEAIMRMIHFMEPKEVEDCKDLLLNLQRQVDEKLSGGS